MAKKKKSQPWVPCVMGTPVPVDRASAGMARPDLETVAVLEHDRGSDGAPSVTRRRVQRRPMAPCLSKMPERLRLAAQTYAQIYEVVQAGGGGVTSEAPGKVDGGIAKREGRQSVALGTTVALRKMNRAIGDGAVKLGRKDRETVVTIRQLVVLIAVGDATLPSIFDLLDVRVTAPRTRAVTDAIRSGLERVADHLGV